MTVAARLDVRLERTYPHPPERVWRALTDPDELARWLLANDFVARVGHRFTLRGTAAASWRGRTDCEVLALDPPRRMVWSWLSTDHGEPTRLSFELEPTAEGTRLRLTHVGESDAATVADVGATWPLKLAALADALDA